MSKGRSTTNPEKEIFLWTTEVEIPLKNGGARLEKLKAFRKKKRAMAYLRQVWRIDRESFVKKSFIGAVEMWELREGIVVSLVPITKGGKEYHAISSKK